MTLRPDAGPQRIRWVSLARHQPVRLPARDPVNMIDANGTVAPVVILVILNPATAAAAAEIVDFP